MCAIWDLVLPLNKYSQWIRHYRAIFHLIWLLHTMHADHSLVPRCCPLLPACSPAACPPDPVSLSSYAIRCPCSVLLFDLVSRVSSLLRFQQFMHFYMDPLVCRALSLFTAIMSTWIQCALFCVRLIQVYNLCRMTQQNEFKIQLHPNRSFK